MRDQSTNITKVHFGEIMSFIGVIYRNMSERLLIGAEIKAQYTCIKQINPSMSYNSQKLRTWSTLTRMLLNRLGSVFYK